MLRESESYRRRLRDDADLEHARWERYSAGKRRLIDLGIEPDEYDARVKALAEELGI